MKLQGVVPDVTAYNALIGACEEDNQLEQSLEIIKSCVISRNKEEELKFLGFKNHKKQIGRMKEDTYSFTVKLISLPFLDKIQKHKYVKSVYFSASHAPPGGAVDSVSLRYKIYIKYKKI